MELFTNLDCFGVDSLFDKLLQKYEQLPFERRYVLMGYWLIKPARWKEYLLQYPKKNHAQRFWFLGVFTGLSNPHTTILDEQLVEILDKVIEKLSSQEDKQMLYRCFTIIRILCCFRDKERSFLQPDCPNRAKVIDILVTLKKDLSPDKLKFGQADNAKKGDEPLSLALDALKGEYTTTMELGT